MDVDSFPFVDSQEPFLSDAPTGNLGGGELDSPEIVPYDPTGGGSVQRAGTPGGIARPGGNPGRRDLSGDTRQVPSPGSQSVPYQTVDVPSQRVPTAPPSSLPPAPAPAPQLPGRQGVPLGLPSAGGNDPLPVPFPVGQTGPNESPENGGPYPDGVSPGAARIPGETGPLILGEPGSIYTVQLSYDAFTIRRSDGRVFPSPPAGNSTFNNIPGPILPYIDIFPSANTGFPTVELGFRYGPNAIRQNIFTSVDTELSFLVLEYFRVNIGGGPVDVPQNGRLPTTADAPARNPGRARNPSPAPLPVPIPVPVPAPGPAPTPQRTPQENPGQPAPAPAPGPGPVPVPLPIPTPGPAPGPAPGPGPADSPAPGPDPDPDPDPPEDPCEFDCDELRRCLAPTIGDELRNVLRTVLVSLLLDALRQQPCSNAELCQRLTDIFRVLTASERFSVERKNCQGQSRAYTVVGRRMEAILPAVEAGTTFIQELIEERLPCGRYVEPSPIASGQTSVGNEVAYVAVDPSVRQVELVLTGAFPASLRIYRQSGEFQEQGKFGAIQEAQRLFAPSFSVYGAQYWVWTRGTLMDVSEFRGRTRYVRIFLEPGLNWVLYDTGLRM